MSRQCRVMSWVMWQCCCSAFCWIVLVFEGFYQFLFRIAFLLLQENYFITTAFSSGGLTDKTALTLLTFSICSIGIPTCLIDTKEKRNKKRIWPAYGRDGRPHLRWKRTHEHLVSIGLYRFPHSVAAGGLERLFFSVVHQERAVIWQLDLLTYPIAS